MPTDYSPERLAYWYLRLNGFLIWENFILHPDQGTDQRTDADLVGVRLGHRKDVIGDALNDDDCVSNCPTYCNVLIAEVKTSQCTLNGPWTRPEDENIQRILNAVGCFPTSLVNQAATGLYSHGRFSNDHATCRLLAFGDRMGELPIEGVPQVLFDHMIEFIFQRLRQFRQQKASVGNWAPDGQKLREFANTSDQTEFKRSVRAFFGLSHG